MTTPTLLSRLAANSAWWPNSFEYQVQEEPSPAFKVLLVVAHPDDESECAGTLYRITHHLGGVVDQVIVTDGEGGSHFSGPAARFYGFGDKGAMGKRLPKLRREEVRRAGQIIGVRRHYFLDQPDAGFTRDAEEGFRLWDVTRVRKQLSTILEAGEYDLVLTLLPEPGTHGHHQAVAALALEAAEKIAAAKRPAVVGVKAGSAVRTAEAPANGPLLSFDRRAPLECDPNLDHSTLDHSIIVNWVIAEHKSQGMFQMEYGRHTHEHFWALNAGREQWNTLRERLGGVAEAPPALIAEAA